MSARWRKVSVRLRETNQNRAYEIEELLNYGYSAAKRAILVCNSLNMPPRGTLDKAFAPAGDYRLAGRPDIRRTLKQGCWLITAEIEVSVMTGQCLDRCSSDNETLRRGRTAGADERHRNQSGVNGHFATENARARPGYLYPKKQT
ncbi:MAG: hypothetical protein H5U08_00370 [Thermogutta sp.]|uniref:hypothetical protein n=1 Tax=Thermogutta sp. TaxID=1962930 RepID=UPI0019900803|nr:hypothetical protein [Thermogutta sp.]MBC7350789.1 hypothetical protein [Thermogutta sp.]